MIKSTPEVSTYFVFKSSPEAFISSLFFKNKNSFTLEPPPRPSPRLGATLPRIIWLALGFLPNYAPGMNTVETTEDFEHKSLMKSLSILGLIPIKIV